jgi:hypothetical protein
LKNFKNKTKATAFALFLVLTIAVTIFALPIANAHVPAWKIPTFSYIVVSPNPVGVGQNVFVIFWIDKMPPTGNGALGDRWENLKVEVTKPDGSKSTLGTYTSDPIGGGYATYTPTVVGTYSFEFTFPEQVATLAGPTGLAGTDSVYVNDTFLASSATATLTVQQEPLPAPISYPLPTDYWTRPIEGQNTEWVSIASNWLGSPQIVGKLQPDGIGPNSPHIMWTKPFQFGGLVGGNYADIPSVTYYSGLSYEGRFTNPLIMHGRLYYNLPKSNDAAGGGYICVDLQTGETLYWQNMSQPGFGQLFDYESPNQHGVIPNGYLWTSSMSDVYDPLTGDRLFGMTNVPAGTAVYGPQGEILRYVLNYNTTASSGWLALWNNTASPSELAAPTGTSGWQWRPVGKSIDASTAYSWNVTIPALPGSSSPAIIKVIPNDIIIGRSSTFSGFSPAFGTPDPYTLWAISDKPASRGQLLWIKNYPAPTGNTSILMGPTSPTARVLAVYERETMRYWGISIDDGSQVWGPTPSESPLDYYQKFGANEVMEAYGNLYTASYGGIVRCYSMTTGNLLWSYNNTAVGLAAVWPNWPIGMAAIADGKVYAFTSEHSPNAPPYKGAKVRAINATTGEEIWTMNGWMSGFQAAGAACAVADGILTFLNLYDMQIYGIGKGPSATTIEAPMTSNELGKSIVIRGTVTDIAAGTRQKEQAARFPNGVPAVSDKSMSAWMEYVYMQKPRPSDVVGVDVSLFVLDENNNYREIGKTTADADGFFSFDWAPDIPGKYTVTAVFDGSESYWPSHAVSAFTVDAGPEPTVEPTPITASVADTYFVPVAAGLFAAIILVGALMVIMLRKRP